ncbi:hypothetical protein [Sphingobacterium kyonggiense]
MKRKCLLILSFAALCIISSFRKQKIEEVVPYSLRFITTFGHETYDRTILVKDQLFIEPNVIFQTRSNMVVLEDLTTETVQTESYDSLISYYLTDYNLRQTFEFDTLRNFKKAVNIEEKGCCINFSYLEKENLNLASSFQELKDTIVSGENRKLIVYNDVINDTEFLLKATISQDKKYKNTFHLINKELGKKYGGICLSYEVYHPSNLNEVLTKIEVHVNQDLNKKELDFINFFSSWYAEHQSRQ